MRQATDCLTATSILTAILWFTLAGGVQAQGTAFYPLAKLVAADGALGDAFATSVAFDGDTVVIGANKDDDLGFFSGSAYIFQRDVGGPDAWEQVAKLTAADGASDDQFGISVGLHGDTVVVGAWGDDDLGTGSGSAYVFQRDAGGPGAWGQVAKLTAADGAAQHWFGHAVALAGDTLVVGAHASGFSEVSSAAYVFQRDAGGPGAWGQVAKLTEPDGANNHHFGYAVAIDGDTVVVGADLDDDLGFFSGSAYVFQRDVGGPNAWGQVVKLTAADGASDDQFGISVALDGDTMLVGAPLGESSAAYVFQRDVGGPDAWGQTDKITGASQFGRSVALDGDTALVGSPREANPEPFSGSAYVFRRDIKGPDDWVQVSKLTAPDGATQDAFGDSIALVGDTLLVGAYQNNNGSGSGSAYIFQEHLVYQFLTVSGTCPGPVDVTLIGATPNGSLAFLWAAHEGTTIFPVGPCPGIEVGLANPSLLAILTADSNGDFSASPTALAVACGKFFQEIDVNSCTASNVIQFP